MRNSRYAILILDSRSDGDRSGTFADVDFLKATIWQSLVDIFAVMGCYINVFRIELDQFVYDIIYFLYAVSFQRRKYFKWESSTLAAIDQIDYFHVIYLFGWTNVHKKQLCLSAQYVDCLCCLNFPRVDIPCFVAEFPSCLFVASSQRYDIICNLHLSFLLFLPFLKG